MTRYAARVDSNHAELESIFRQLLADHVTNTSAWGDGAGDLFVSFGIYCCFIEIKRDEKADFTAHQVRFHNTHPGCTFRCESVTQAIEICALIRKRAGLLA